MRAMVMVAAVLAVACGEAELAESQDGGYVPPLVVVDAGAIDAATPAVDAGSVADAGGYADGGADAGVCLRWCARRQGAEWCYNDVSEDALPDDARCVEWL